MSYSKIECIAILPEEKIIERITIESTVKSLKSFFHESSFIGIFDGIKDIQCSEIMSNKKDINILSSLNKKSISKNPFYYKGFQVNSKALVSNYCIPLLLENRNVIEKVKPLTSAELENIQSELANNIVFDLDTQDKSYELLTGIIKKLTDYNYDIFKILFASHEIFRPIDLLHEVSNCKNKDFMNILYKALWLHIEDSETKKSDIDSYLSTFYIHFNFKIIKGS